jgi:hypothetical protein
MAAEPGGLPRVGAFLGDPAVRVRRVGPARHDGASVYIWRDMIEALLDTAALATAPLCTALALGVFGRGPGGSLVELRGWVDFEPWESERAFVADLHANWQPTMNRVLRANPGLAVCGWVHARRGSGGLLSDAAAMVHRSLFGLPWQLALVVDADARQLGVWGPARDGHLVGVGFGVVSRGVAPGESHADH